MITVIRTATAFPGMTGEAISWAKEVAALVKRVTGREQFVCSSFGECLPRLPGSDNTTASGNMMKCGPKCWAMGSIELRLRKLGTCSRRVAIAIRFGNTNRSALSAFI